MSGKSVKEQQQQVTAMAETGDVPVGQAGTQTAPPIGTPAQGSLTMDGEIRDPMGNFSEQVGAYFG